MFMSCFNSEVQWASGVGDEENHHTASARFQQRRVSMAVCFFMQLSFSVHHLSEDDHIARTWFDGSFYLEKLGTSMMTS